jgi:hypothetical protein
MYGNCSCWSTTGTVSVPTTADTIDEVDETFSIANELFRLRVQLSTTTMPYCGNDHSCFGYRRICCVYFTLSNPSAVDTSYTFVLTNGTAGSADYTTTDVIVTVPAGATTGTVSVPTTADTIDEVDETFSIANGTVSATANYRQ